MPAAAKFLVGHSGRLKGSFLVGKAAEAKKGAFPRERASEPVPQTGKIYGFAVACFFLYQSALICV